MYPDLATDFGGVERCAPLSLRPHSWRAGRVAEGGVLIRRRWCKSSRGSNPLLCSPCPTGIPARRIRPKVGLGCEQDCRGRHQLDTRRQYATTRWLASRASHSLSGSIRIPRRRCGSTGCGEVSVVAAPTRSNNRDQGAVDQRRALTAANPTVVRMVQVSEFAPHHLLADFQLLPAI